LKSPIELLSDLMEDIRRLDPCVRGLDRDLLTIEHRVKHEGVSFLTHALPAFGKHFDKCLEKGRLTSPPRGFAPIREGAIPRLFSGMLCKVFHPYTGLLLEDADVSVLKSIRQICYFMKKLLLSESNERKLDAQAQKKFWDTDRSLQGLVLDERKVAHLRHVCQFILPTLESADNDYAFKHGPGAVSEGLKPNQKWSGIWEMMTKVTYPLDGLGLDLFGLSERIEALTTETLTAAPSRWARLVTVPKSSTSRRTITVEPVVHQYIQQGFNERLRSSIEACPILSSSLALTDQRKNQVLALEGSRTGLWSTIDLSSASDLLSCEAVKHVFWRSPTFTDRVLNCRTTHIKDGKNSQPRPVVKFAGMGNACTFPVQSVVFAMLCIAAMTSDGRTPSHRKIRRTARMVRVYGDDIIVPTHHYATVVDWLTAFGFRVNVDKTFSEGNFRESCGVDAWKGIDVTPIYLRQLPVTGMRRDLLAKVLETSNHLWMEGYFKLSQTLVDEVERQFKKLPLRHIEDGYLGLVNRQNARTFNCWSKRYQRPAVRAFALTASRVSDRLDGYPALLKSLTTPLIGRDREHLLSVPRKYSVVVKRRIF